MPLGAGKSPGQIAAKNATLNPTGFRRTITTTQNPLTFYFSALHATEKNTENTNNPQLNRPMKKLFLLSIVAVLCGCEPPPVKTDADASWKSLAQKWESISDKNETTARLVIEAAKQREAAYNQSKDRFEAEVSRMQSSYAAAIVGLMRVIGTNEIELTASQMILTNFSVGIYCENEQITNGNRTIRLQTNAP